MKNQELPEDNQPENHAPNPLIPIIIGILIIIGFIIAIFIVVSPALAP